MEYIKINSDNYEALRLLMTEYYRDGEDGEDSDTPQSTLDEFIALLFSMIVVAR